MKRRSSPDKTVTIGWSGRWLIGWFLPRHATGWSEPLVKEIYAAGSPCFRIRVTMEVIKDKRGRPIVRRFPKADK